MLHDAARRVGFASASIWAPVPHYVATAPNPKATRALLDKARRRCSTSASTSPTSRSRPTAWERSVDEVVAGDADASSYVERLERRYDEPADAGPTSSTTTTTTTDDDDEDWLDEDDLPSGESLAEDFERYLREQGDE